MTPDLINRIVKHLANLEMLSLPDEDTQGFRRQVAEAIQEVCDFSGHHPMEGIERRRLYARGEDMSRDGTLQLMVEDDGDVIVSMNYGVERGGFASEASVQFCTVGSGGGQSRHTWLALLALIHAMEADNAERPQNREP